MTFRGLLPSGHFPLPKYFDVRFACIDYQVQQYLSTFEAIVMLFIIVPTIDIGIVARFVRYNSRT